MSQDNPDLDQRLARFEAQLDRFSLALHQWQQADGVAERASAADVAQRMRTIEETLDREALALRILHQEPLRQLQAQAANLSEICASAAQSVQGLDQAGSRLEAIQADVHLHLTDLSRALQTLVSDLRANTSTALSGQGPPASWPLDRIVHLHDELRRGAADGTPPPPDAAASTSGADGTRHRFLQPALEAEASHDDGLLARQESSAHGRRSWIMGAALLVAASVLVFIFERRIESKLNDAGARVAAAERQATAAAQAANQEIVAAREEANRQIAAARDSAQRAETVGAILTAPDLIRFSLTGGASVDRSSAQVLWSRTRGLVMSASRLPAAPPETIYQLWLKTSGDPVSAGVFVPDATGRATLVTDVPPKVSGPVLGAEVTIEPTGGRNAPSGRPLLVRYPPI
jgi:anti-sigma-K factor RskA